MGSRKRRVRPSSWAWVALVAVGVAVFAAGIYVGRWRDQVDFPAPRGAEDTAPRQERSAAERSGRAAPIPRTGIEVGGPEAEEGEEAAAASTTTSRVALVIDDLGRSLDEVDAVAALGISVSYAVLPFESRTAEVVAELRRRSAELLCHLPMEPGNGANPGPGALTLSMSRRQLGKAARAALDAVPGAIGVNNHMGSVLTADPEAMETVMKVLAKRDLFFLDSRTSADSLGYKVARRLGVAATERQVFLDPDLDPEAIGFQFDRLLQVARLNGTAVGIGHPHAVTLAVLAQRIPEAVARGVEFVPVSYLLDRDHAVER